MAEMMCSNCEKSAGPGSLILHQEGAGTIATICGECQKTVLMAKIVLKRDVPKGKFSYEGYLPAQCFTEPYAD